MKRGTIDPPIAEKTSTAKVDTVWACCLVRQADATASPSPIHLVCDGGDDEDQSDLQGALQGQKQELADHHHIGTRWPDREPVDDA